MRLVEQDPQALLPMSGAPHNLDFSAGLRGWDFFRSSEYASYSFDAQITHAGKATLAVQFYKPFSSGSAGFLSYKPFAAERYRSQRLRMIAYVKVENMHQPIVELMVRGSIERIASLTGRSVRGSRLTRSRIASEGDSNWKRHELVIDVPADAHDVCFSFGTHEQGKMWLAGVHLDIVDLSVPLTGTILRPPSQQPLNLDFSDGLEYWYLEERPPFQHEYGVDQSVVDRSTTSAYLKAQKVENGSSCVLQQLIRSEHYQGKRVRFSASLKTLDVVSQASLFIGSPFAGMEDRFEETIKGTTDWTTYTLTWQVTENTWGLLCFGVTLHGKGQLWLRDVSLEVSEEE